MTSASPTILALETDAAWVVVLAVSTVTLPAALILRRLIGRPGGVASGILLGLPLLLPLVAALVFHGALLPELAVLRPAREVFRHGTADLLHLLYFHDGDAVTPYVAWGTARNWVLLVGLGFSSLMLLRRALGMLLVHRLVRRCRTPAPAERAEIRRVLSPLARRAGLAREPEVLFLPPGAGGVFAVGSVRPRILIAESLRRELEPEEIEAVLAHEVAHVSARDIRVVFLAGVLRDMVAWNPLAHLAFRKLVSDRESEADRRAAAMTGKPLAVASSLLKMCQTGRRLRPTPAALSFLRPGSRVARRVRALIDVADGRAALTDPRRLPYAAAAVLVAALGLQAGAELAAERGALAIVWGAPAGEMAQAYAPPRAATEPPGQRTARKGKGAKKKARRAEIESPQRNLARSESFRAEDLELWLSQMAKLAARGVSPATLAWETRRDWEAVPIRCTGGSLCIYRVDGI
ncbi:MAG TPA: M56 family metallopeptidase [Actinomycetota bacterium]|nr:M56 family metallopeptidase [Actinomycetota bacterium]